MNHVMYSPENKSLLVTTGSSAHSSSPLTTDSSTGEFCLLVNGVLVSGVLSIGVQDLLGGLHELATLDVKLGVTFSIS